MLKDHADAAAQPAQVSLSHRGGRGPSFGREEQPAATGLDCSKTADGKPPFVGRLEQIDAAHQCGLARAGIADDAINLPVADGQIDAVQRRDRAAVGGRIAFFDAAQLNHRFHPFPRVLSRRRKSRPVVRQDGFKRPFRGFPLIAVSRTTFPVRAGWCRIVELTLSPDS